MLETVKMVLLGLMAVCLLWLFYKLLRGKSAKKVFIWSAISGVGALFLLSLVGERIAPTVMINGYTVATAGVLGIPGVILMMITKILWQL